MSEIIKFTNLTDIATHFRKDLTGDHRPLKELVLFFAHNGTGKTRLSMEFKQAGKQFDEDGNVTARDTLYFNAFTEDLFSWNNDLENDTDRFLNLNTDSAFFDGLRELELDAKIESFFHNYVDLKFDINYVDGTVRFSRSIIVEGAEQKIENIKISRGEETLFMWSFFLTICQLAIDKDPAYKWVKFVYIDDPISSLDENNAIAIACDLANLLAKKDAEGKFEMLIKTVISTHHSLFFNVLFNEFGRKVKNKRYFLHFKEPNEYALQDTGDSPFFHHIATISELKKVVESDKIFTYHFNALRSIMGEDFRFKSYGLAPKSAADFAFLLHGFHFLSKEGTMAIILPHGVLFRSGSEERIRRKLLEDGNIDTVIGLPANLFFSTGIPVSILVLKKCKKFDDVLFINAVDHFEKGKRQNNLLPENIDKIVETYRDRKEEIRYSRRVSMDEIVKNEFNLNISRYVNTSLDEEIIDLYEVNAKLVDLDKNINQARETHNKFLEELGLPPI